jgi:hypothetical protein
MMSMDEWRKSPQSARNNPKLSPEKAQQIADEAIAGGQKWDVQEKINARRQAELNTECGLGLGKVLAPAKFDALIPKPRCQAGAGAFGTYFVHPSEKYGVKLFRNGDEDDVGFEFDMLDRARAAGVNAPDPLSMNAVRDMDGEIRSQTLVLSHMKGYKTLDAVHENPSKAPLITQLKIAREFRKLHVEGMAHGDIHGGNIMVNSRTKKPAIVDFGYATHLSAIHPGHGRTGIDNMMSDLRKLPNFFGFPRAGAEFSGRYSGVLYNIEKQAKAWDRSTSYSARNQAWDRFEVGVKRYHDALERELLLQDKQRRRFINKGFRPRSRFISGADQPRIPGLTRGILAANVNTAQREIAELQLARGDRPSFLNSMAKGLGVKPARLQGALQPERDARLAKQRRQPYGTPIPRPSTPKPFVQKLNSVGVLRWVTNPAIPKASATPAPRSLGRLARSIMERSGNESMSLETALRLARNEQRGFSSWKD